MKTPLLLCLAVLLGFVAGRISHPKAVKAAGSSHVQRMNISGAIPEPVVGGATAVGISCVGNGDCYVLTQE